MGYQLGVDVGGTFTDVLLMDEESGVTWRAKTPSTPADQSEGVLEGIRKVCQLAGVEPGAIGRVLHGTTVATNAILEGRGARVGLVTTAGFRQVLQVARSYVPGGLGGWITWPKPTPLARLEDTVEVPERMSSRGEVLRPLDEEAARAALAHLARQGVEALTIALVNAFANPAHERRLGELAAEVLPGVPVSLSSEILPEIREYERTITTVANSYVRPVVGRYLASLTSKLAEGGVGATVHVLRSDGGLASIPAATVAPVNLLMSGPAGGVAGAIWAAGQAGFENLLTFDMGGTSTDVCLVQHGRAQVGRDTVVGDLAVRASSVDVRTVGAGGGSIAHVPELTRALRVGPQSAGAEPGPAAYGKGGTEPTVTDANVVLGYLPPRLIGGEMTLDVGAAEAAVAKVAEAMGLPDVQRAAAGIIDIVNENMFGALRLVSVQQGYDPRDFALVAFGGAGPLHANALARLLGSWPVVVPLSPGVLCAYGDATTSLRDEAARTFIRRFSETSDEEVAGVLAELAEEARATLDAEGVPRAEQTVAWQVDVRYHGQGFEVPVDLEPELVAGGRFLEEAGRRFDAEHRRLFLFDLEAEHELVNLRAIAQARPTRVAAPVLEEGGPDPGAARVGSQRIWVDGSWHEAGLYDRARLKAGNVVPGPAVVTEMDSTTLVLPGHRAEVDRIGTLLIRPEEA
ncbi:hydantoinase/oxoprolinase family protein [Aciditerrimonas ferrireducens]|uniref:hydantoinase/oxoprolinase family protein n=1 Tax=Aciditerrimonas ferrireducens TaxID=667306 RepID=UPI002005B7B5|nr:hydantoinase/oxoprolinase family protein [Aciditerrimonas ferrireducens]MCK4176480.1 hydantoinase/oxoprolinase family protein [Aciditerrimonas ferrireducens]